MGLPAGVVLCCLGRKPARTRPNPCTANKARNSAGPHASEWGARPNASSTSVFDTRTAATTRRVPANANQGDRTDSLFIVSRPVGYHIKGAAGPHSNGVAGWLLFRSQDDEQTISTIPLVGVSRYPPGCGGGSGIEYTGGGGIRAGSPFAGMGSRAIPGLVGRARIRSRSRRLPAQAA